MKQFLLQIMFEITKTGRILTLNSQNMINSLSLNKEDQILVELIKIYRKNNKSIIEKKINGV